MLSLKKMIFHPVQLACQYCGYHTTPLGLLVILHLNIYCISNLFSFIFRWKVLPNAGSSATVAWKSLQCSIGNVIPSISFCTGMFYIDCYSFNDVLMLSKLLKCICFSPPLAWSHIASLCSSFESASKTRPQPIYIERLKSTTWQYFIVRIDRMTISVDEGLTCCGQDILGVTSVHTD